ncbi:MAG TPA: hypothetical protein ENJ13_05420 [Chromatiales bacterium]|nr:hypothetical protein [Chromatiales bacterium]
MSNAIKRTALLIATAMILTACKPDSPDQGDTSNETTTLFGAQAVSGEAAALTTSEYNQLTAEEQYAVSNRLMGTLYKGIPVDEFFDLNQGLASPKVGAGGNFINRTALQLTKELPDPGAYIEQINEKYDFNSTRYAQEMPLALMFDLPVSRDLFTHWMAYTLANTILFSPALEMESADYFDVHRVYSKLVNRLNMNMEIREIIYQHMISQENWRRFRSPEDNTREMIEIYLGLFDRDDEVPKASQACQNWYLTGDNQDYQLVITLDENIVPQKVLGRWINTCFDFYRTVADHPKVITRMIYVLVNHFFIDMDQAKRAALVQSIANSNPTRFEHIFTAILFSREYLLNSDRPRRLEETFFNIAARTQWKPHRRFFQDLNNPSGSSSYPTLAQMKQPGLTLKLGRWPFQPLDSLSFSYYHKLVRERLLLDRRTNLTNANDAGWEPAFLEKAEDLSDEDFLHYLFLSTVGRKANSQELTTLNDVFANRGYDRSDRRTQQALISFDYISRLPETYFNNRIN